MTGPRGLDDGSDDDMAHRPSRRGEIAERVFIVLCILAAFAVIAGVIGLAL